MDEGEELGNEAFVALSELGRGVIVDEAKPLRKVDQVSALSG